MSGRPRGLPGLRGAEHLGITVPDLDEAHRFLVDVLGARPVFDGGRTDDADVMTRVLGANPGDAMRYRFYRLGHGLNLEVFEYETEDRGRHPGNHQAGGHHIALYVDDIAPAVAHLRAHGIAVDDPESIADGPAAGSHWVYFKAPWGLQMELVSYPDGKAYEREAEVRLWNPRFPEQ
jgi:catechol 2,3-dioxygenase-like lactoylglutathione lyase family enzyme